MKAYEVLEKYDWTQRAFARDKNGECVDDIDKAVSFCMVGAMRKAYGFESDEYITAFTKLNYHIRGKYKKDHIVYWNDLNTTTKAKVIATLKKLDI